jgi:hypothetical protein
LAGVIEGGAVEALARQVVDEVLLDVAEGVVEPLRSGGAELCIREFVQVGGQLKNRE